MSLEEKEKNNEKEPIGLLNEETLFIVSQTFKALSDNTRIKILYLRVGIISSQKIGTE